MLVDIPYGKEIIKLIIPDKNMLDVILSSKSNFSNDENKIITEAQASPIKSGKLSELAKSKKNAVILVSDITRPCPSYKFLLYLTEELNKGGIKNCNIKIILGLGIHRKHTE